MMSRRVAPPSLSISRTQAIGIWLLLLLIAGVALLLALMLGGSDLTMGQSLQALLVRGDDLATSVVYDLRLPRALAAFATGGLLAVAGCLMQVLLRNPLADPYILGLSGAAAVGALVAMLLGTSMFLVNSGAAIGALLSSLLIFAVSHRDLVHLRGPGAEFDSSRLILTGVMIAALWGAIVTLILVMAPDHNLRGMLFWIVGISVAWIPMRPRCSRCWCCACWSPPWRWSYGSSTSCCEAKRWQPRSGCVSDG